MSWETYWVTLVCMCVCIWGVYIYIYIYICLLRGVARHLTRWKTRPVNGRRSFLLYEHLELVTIILWCTNIPLWSFHLPIFFLKKSHSDGGVAKYTVTYLRVVGRCLILTALLLSSCERDNQIFVNFLRLSCSTLLYCIYNLSIAKILSVCICVYYIVCMM